MDKLIDKLSSYNLMNNLLPGVIFCSIIDISHIFQIESKLVENLFIYYFIGMLISRIGSLAIEPICKKLKFVEFEPYENFVKASKVDEKINTLSETNNMYRTMLTMVLLFIFIEIFEFLDIINLENAKIIIILLFVILFGFSYRKQTKYIVKRVKKVIDSNE